jgi:hypothetical protein
MRYSRPVLAALTASLVVGIAIANPPSALPSFDELFGMDETQAVSVYDTEIARCLSNALEDFNLALSGQNPAHSKNPAFPQLLDGGTTFWKGDCYELTIYKSLTSYRLPDGALVSGFIVGPSLQLRLTPNASKTHPIERTRFIFIQKRAAT